MSCIASVSLFSLFCFRTLLLLVLYLNKALEKRSSESIVWLGWACKVGKKRRAK